MAEHSITQQQGFFNGKRWRTIVENLTAYLFLFPASLIIFIFGLFPIAFAFFVSLHDWRRFPEEYTGMENYVDALGNFAFVLFFWVALGAVFYAGLTFYRVWQAHRTQWRTWLLIIPAIANAVATAYFTDWFFKLLPAILEVPQRLPRAQARSRELFIQEFFNSFSFPNVAEAAEKMLLAMVIAAILTMTFMLLTRLKNYGTVLMQMTVAIFLLIGAAFIVSLTLDQMEIAFDAAREAGEELPLWSQILLISAGAGLLLLAYFLWQLANHPASSDRRFLLLTGAAIVLLLGGYLLVAEIPHSFADMDRDLRQAFWVTVLYVLGTVPIQLALGLVLAYLLFYNTYGKSFFRIIYFLPYITPFAATALVFGTIFSNKPDSPANQALGLFGIPDQKWLLEPTPIGVLLFGEGIPGWLEGPSLALTAIMIWTTWTYVGYDTVIFLAGLGNIPGELYEAARIDGADGWRLFRHITLPLLSPTTFFLTLIAVIGTFQAFTQIWIMRNPANFDAVDTVGVEIFETINSTRPQYGYGSAMAFVLFMIILIITIIQNRFAGRKVFYG